MRHNAEEQDLIAALLKGDDNAFDQLFRQYFSALSFFAYQVTGQSQVAEDIAQETFIKLWRYRHNLAHVTQLRSYLYGIVQKACADWLSKQQKQKKYRPSQETLSQNDVERHIIRAETARELHRVMNLLSPRTRQVFTLYYLEGRSTREISQLLNLTVNTVTFYRKSALETIRKTFIPG